ncbi:MAG TPA: DNA polymerase III subunit alpha, partial [Planctomycetota bacterium]|nr:DNA polymerase III subunit alpha [Planctomycetota bacterium]
LYGLLPFARETARVGLRAVFGAELVHAGRRVVAVARDRRGYESLCALLTDLHLAADFDLPRACASCADGLWFVCGDPGLLPELAVRLDRSRLLVALPPHGVLPTADAAPPPMQGAGRKLPDPGPQWPRQQLLEAAAALDLDLVAVREVWFARREDFAAHLLLLAVKWNRAFRSDQPAAGLHGIGHAQPTMHLPARGEHHAGHGDQPASIAAAERLLADCTLAFPQQAEPVFPAFTVPGGETPARHLQQLADAGLRRRYGTADADTAARLQRELRVIERMGFAPYFLVVCAIADLARARSIPFVGRGSAAGSLVAYCLGLTDVCPMRHGLLFERFLNPTRSDLPDIDLDFCWRRRDQLLAAVYDHFGHDRVAMIATYNTCGPRAAYAEAAKAAGLPPAEVARRSRLLPWHRGSGLDLAAAVAATPGFLRAELLPPWRERAIVATAQQLLAAPRHLGVHPGGVVITPGPIVQYAPLERAAKGLVVTQYDMHFVEGLGLVKIDLLGNRALTIVQDCCALLRSQDVAPPDLEHIAEDDAATAELLRTGRTLACFQVESPAMRTLLRQLQAGDMTRVIQAVALVRPGPAAAGMKDAFVRRARGLEPVTAAHPLLAGVFADTFGIMLYQEDVIRASMAVAGVDAAAGDRLRRLLGKRDAGGAEQDAFLVAGLRTGLPRSALEQVWAEMARFAGYSFCKAHAATYGRIAYCCVFLKARWPVAFLVAMLDNDAGYYDKGVYVEEAKRLGARFLPPCIDQGDAGFTLTSLHTIRVGLREVRGLGEQTLARLLATRRAGGSFRSLDDFLARVAPARDEAENLILCGALDCLHSTRPELLWRLQVASTPRAALQRQAPLRAALFADAHLPRDMAFPALPEFGEERRIRHELHVLGYSLAAHPVDALWQRRGHPQAYGCVPCGKVEALAGQRVRVFGWAVAFRRHRTDDGKAMAFVTLEDGTGIVEGTLFHKVFEQCGGELQGRGPFVVGGVVEERLGGVGLRVFDVQAVGVV